MLLLQHWPSFPAIDMLNDTTKPNLIQTTKTIGTSIVQASAQTHTSRVCIALHLGGIRGDVRKVRRVVRS